MPMSIDNIFGIGGTALHAQMIRLNTTASNLANAGTTSATEKEAYRGKRTIFKSLMDEEMILALLMQEYVFGELLLFLLFVSIEGGDKQREREEAGGGEEGEGSR